MIVCFVNVNNLHLCAIVFNSLVLLILLILFGKPNHFHRFQRKTLVAKFGHYNIIIIFMMCASN